MAVALYMPTLNLAMHPRAGRDQHNQTPLGRFGLVWVLLLPWLMVHLLHIQFV
jgi:hypothetical protein